MHALMNLLLHAVCGFLANSGWPLPFPLSDQRPLPSTFSNRLVTKEGASYAWLCKNVLNFERWSGCAATNTPQTVTPGTPKTGDPQKDWMVPQGWTVHSTIWLPDGSAELGLYWPFATVIYKGRNLVVLIRCASNSSSSTPVCGLLWYVTCTCSKQVKTGIAG